MQYSSTYRLQRIDSSSYLLHVGSNVKMDEVVATYLLQAKGADMVPDNHQLKVDAVLQYPVESWVLSTTAQLHFFELLGRLDAITGFPNVSFIYSQDARVLVDRGDIIDLGSDLRPNMERLISLRPEFYVTHRVEGGQRESDRLKKAGIQSLLNLDFQEVHPLGMAEHIKLYATLLGIPEKGDSIFSVIHDNYKALQSNINNGPKVLAGYMYDEIWFAPSGGSAFATYITDAGGDYLFQSKKGSGSVQLSFETVFEQSDGVEIWIGAANHEDKQSLISTNRKYQQMYPFKHGRIFGYSKRKHGNSAIDFFESGYARPDLVLQDYVHIVSGASADSLFYFNELVDVKN
ncbi:MAG: ABC transporter substrate-binding protein [Cyclobacteriaceae bacterium]|nr:ABC transporter substrate-binding protein [Cyclobacteriaceae bacterium]MCH8516657.1 ABC transporter substrate-binding protein [Cyclobacteriaceae bacterium]